jgi:16S rRNA (guanine527-N7)-methyltransferase
LYFNHYVAKAIDQFESALEAHAPAFGVQISARVLSSLRDYFTILHEWNPRLHLVAPCSPEEFATRHVLESLLAIKYIQQSASVADIGSGGGLPIIPCLVARPDIRATLLEASAKKAVFLREAMRLTKVSERAEVIAERFEKCALTDVAVVTCRALDRFRMLFSEIYQWAPPGSVLILFAGPSLQTEIERHGLAYETLQIPESDQRFVFIIEKAQKRLI